MLGVTNIYAIFLAYIKEKLASLITLTRSMCGRRAENTRHMGIISLIKTNISFTDASSLYFDETSNIFLTRRTSIRKLPNSREGISDRVTRDGDNETKYEEGGEAGNCTNIRVDAFPSVKRETISANVSYPPKKFGKRRKVVSYRITFEPKCTRGSGNRR